MARIEGQPNLSQFAEAVVDAASEQIRVSIPGVFLSVSNDLKSGTVQPAVGRQNSTSDPGIPDVPIMFPRFRGGSITWPVQAGDQCLLVFSDRSLDDWEDKDGQSVVTASDGRTHDITDAVAIPIGISASSGTGGTVKIDCGTGGKVAIGNSGAELISLVTQVLDSFLTPGTIGIGVAPGAPVPIDPGLATALGLLKTQLETIKGSL